MSEPLWQFEYSVDCRATPRFAWNYWTDVSNWNDPPAEIELEGPFASGSRLTTRIPGQEPFHSVIRNVIAEREATIDMQLPGAVLSFHWRFDELSTGEDTRLTQRLTLSGENAQGFIDQIRVFEKTVPEGMGRLASAISFAAQGRNRQSLSNLTFLLTGAHGFIGAWIVKRLLAGGARVVIFDQSSDPRRLRLIMTDDEIAAATLIPGDITEPEALSPIIEEFAVTNIIHLAGLQVPICRGDPRLGAMVNVIGTINVLEAARRAAGSVSRVVYASSAAVFGMMDEERPLTERDAAQPETHYGAFKRCNEDNARVFFLDNGVNSIGLRPLTIYGVGRDFGMTSDPTKAMKAAVVGRPFHIRFGGRTDFQYVGDTADTFIRAATSDLLGAHVFNLHGDTVRVADIVAEIERVWPESSGKITIADEPLAIPAEMDDAAIRAALGPLPKTQLAEGVEATIRRFAELQREGRLDTGDLDQ